jgi:type II secretory pathway pseudopilin PulG
LIITVILLAVLAAIGAAAISLSARERINASAKGKRDRMAACAQAARLAVWSELAKYGRGYFESANAPSTITLPDGTNLTAPAHYAEDMTSSMHVRDVVVKNAVGCGAGGARADLTNTFHAIRTDCNSDAYQVVARCTDASGNELEIEFTTGLAL